MAILVPASRSTLAPTLNPGVVLEAIRRALAEDIGNGDLTTTLTVAPDATASARLVAKSHGRVAGLDVARLVFRELDADARWLPEVRDGQPVQPGQVLARLEGLAAALLSGERTALNFVQRMSGIATASAELVALAGGRAKVVDSRKTAPGLRALDKYAVAVGGASNHRFGLFDGVLIKENHIRAAGGIAAAVAGCRQGVPLLTKIEVEVTTLDELRQALEAGVDVIMLDNMSLDEMAQAVRLTAGRAQLEASGGVTRATIEAVVGTGVDVVSCGALTHSVTALDVSLLIEL